MKATPQESFGLDMDGAERRLDGKRAAHIVLHYVKTITKTLGCLLGLNRFCNLSFGPQRAYFMYC